MAVIVGVIQYEVQPQITLPPRHCFHVILLPQNALTVGNNIHPIHPSQLLIHLNGNKLFKGQGDDLSV